MDRPDRGRSARRSRDLDFVLTHVDDRFDTRMRDLIGADAARVLPLLEQHDFTFLIEDPATIWNLGPQRYPQIAARYQPLTKHADSWPSISTSSSATRTFIRPNNKPVRNCSSWCMWPRTRSLRVALYFENSILPPDWQLLGSAAANVSKLEGHAASLTIASREGVGLAWPDQALVDGRPWPVRDGATIWLTPGEHVISPSTQELPLELRDFNGTLRTAAVVPGGLTFSYESNSRALATLSAHPKHVEVDGEVFDLATGLVLLLPRGQHIVTATQ